MLTITYNPKHDLRNWMRIAKSDGAKFVLTRFYPFDRTIPLDERNAGKILETLPKKTAIAFQQQAHDLERRWASLEQSAINAISNFLDTKPYPIAARASLTTAYRMPYDVRDHWFMIPTHKDQRQQLRVILHELFHLHHLRRSPDTPRNELEETVECFLQQHWGK